MYKNKVSVKVILFVLLVSAAILTGCANAATQSAASSGTGVVSSVTVTDKIETTGNLSADQLAALTWGTSGTVGTVNAKVGQQVKAGDVLATLKADTVPSDIATAQADLATAKRALADLMSSNSELAAAQQAVADAQVAVDTAQKKVDSLYYPRASDAIVMRTQAQIALAQRQLAIKSYEYRALINRSDKNPEKAQALYNMTNAQVSLNNLIANYNWYTGKATDLDAAQYRAALAVAQASLEDAQRRLDILKDGPDPVEIASAQAKVDAAQSNVNSISIIAPFDGEILTVETSANNPVASGDTAIELVNRNTLKVDTLIDETSISQVSEGDTAEITLDALPGVTLKGTVTVVGSIGATVNGLVKYTVTVSLQPTDEKLRFGATANVTIITSEPHTMLAVPVSAIQSGTQGEYVVVVKADGSTQRVTVESGDLSNNLVTFTTTGDIKDGDQVELATSSSSSSNRNGGGGGFFPGGG
jgi:HlyD family secretion protein